MSTFYSDELWHSFLFNPQLRTPSIWFKPPNPKKDNYLFNHTPPVLNELEGGRIWSLWVNETNKLPIYRNPLTTETNFCPLLHILIIPRSMYTRLISTWVSGSAVHMFLVINAYDASQRLELLCSPVDLQSHAHARKSMQSFGIQHQYSRSLLKHNVS